MTLPTTRLFDRTVLRQRPHLHRADFLYVEAAQELVARLALVTRFFDKTLVVAPMTEGLSAVWANHLSSVTTLAGPHAPPGRSPHVVCDVRQPFLRCFDLTLALHDLPLASDPVTILGELRGTLRPDGLFLGATLVSGTLRELTDALLAAEADLSGGAQLRVAPFADVRRWGDALAKAGFALPVADEVRLTVRYASLATLFHDFSQMGLRRVLTARAPAPRSLFQRAEAIYRERHGATDGRLPVTFALGFLSGWAPDPSQQRPARRGSATTRLEDALKSMEPPPRK